MRLTFLPGSAVKGLLGLVKMDKLDINCNLGYSLCSSFETVMRTLFPLFLHSLPTDYLPALALIPGAMQSQLIISLSPLFYQYLRFLLVTEMITLLYDTVKKAVKLESDTEAKG